MGILTEVLDSVRPMHVAIGVASLILLRIIYLLILYPHFLSPLRHVPGPPTPLTSLRSILYGHFPAIIRSEAGIIQREWAKRYGGFVRAVGPFGIERVICMGRETMGRVLGEEWVDYPRPAYMRNILGMVAGYGLLTVTGNEHRQMRKTMNPAFSLSNLIAQTDMYYDHIETLIEMMDFEISSQLKPSEGRIMLMYSWMSKVTLDIICDTAFGYRSNSLRDPHNELTEAYHNLLNLENGSNITMLMALISIPGMPWFMNSKWGYKFRKIFQLSSVTAPGTVLIESMSRIRRISAQILADKIHDSGLTAADLSTKKDIMSIMVRARKGDEDAEEKGEAKHGVYKLSDEALVDQVLTFLGAGHETTASGLSWTLWLLAQNPTVQAELRAELTPLFDAEPRPGYRALKECKMLDCVVMESLRVMPPVPMTIRQAAKSNWIEGHWVRKGTYFYIPIRVINTSRSVWGEDAETFRPSRWLDLPSDYVANYHLMSFIQGPHACIGKTMSILEMKAVLAAIIVKFEFLPSHEGQVAKPTAAITMKPEDDMPLLVRPVQRGSTAQL
ncbi:cytochrome P450 [Stereum hirsutum FP-91666 SS1]|uniref:cytochrome P450 n=1 Tax=Stereum hirsutum (strain FP-91666) TaxID=721885 RepID=UPI000440B5CA|nr:cytochrome P450 [Stereum hirsutum FP-91666 SS1]EIM88719.1 cytochrome P450 [Stereum hirsutum FP-91666 SS1]